MLKKTSKLLGLFLLLLLSFIYTDKVFSSARLKDPVMKQVINYKTKNDLKPVEPIITEDELILGYSGLEVDAKRSYNNMKKNDKFDSKKIIYNQINPKTSISKTYDYYIKQGNPSKKQVSIIFKINQTNNNIDYLLKQISKYNINVTFFVDGAWLEKNIETAFKIVNSNCEIYNMGYNGIYQRNMISVTNNLIESITLKNSKFCLNENKNKNAFDICKKKRMYTIKPTMIEPTISDLKKNLKKGAVISYDLDNFDYNMINLVIKIITSRGYNLKPLSKLITE